ncbi:hypothetical protein J3E69DRAFT_338024 [Trichoderma sp. SZMC 28015]
MTSFESTIKSTDVLLLVFRFLGVIVVEGADGSSSNRDGILSFNIAVWRRLCLFSHGLRGWSRKTAKYSQDEAWLLFLKRWDRQCRGYLIYRQYYRHRDLHEGCMRTETTFSSNP